jgi:hypothetical protein
MYHAAIKNRYGLQTIASKYEQEVYEDIWNMCRDTNDWKAQFDCEDPAEGLQEIKSALENDDYKTAVKTYVSAGGRLKYTIDET